MASTEDYLNNMTKNAPKQVTPALFFGQLFQSRDITHLVHLNTKSFAEHKALDGYYNEILELTDKLIEAYQGTMAFGNRVNITIPASEYINAQQHLTFLTQYIERHRHTVCSETSIQNIIDEIQGLIQKTLYLLSLS